MPSGRYNRRRAVLTDEAKDEAAKAKEQAGQAGHQAKAAAKSGGRALKHAAGDAADEVRDVASDVADKADDVAQDVAQEAVSVAHRLRIAAPDLTLAAVGLAVTVYACRNDGEAHRLDLHDGQGR
jgi:hypothetical protein